MAGPPQKPLELIQARSLMGSLSTAAFLVDEDGRLLFYNDAAGELLGLKFEEAGPMEPQEWGGRFEPRNEDGEIVAVEDLPLTIALRQGRPGHSELQITGADGKQHRIAVSAVPIRGGEIQKGAFAIFWPLEE